MPAKRQYPARKRSFIVALEIPEEVSIAAMKSYIAEAVGAWKGQYPTDEPMFYLDNNTITVTQNRKQRK